MEESSMEGPSLQLPGDSPEHVRQEELVESPGVDRQLPHLVKGLVVHSVDEARELVNMYSKSTKVKMVIRKHDKTCLKFICSKGRYQPSKSTGKRPNTHFTFTDCQAEIRWYKSPQGYLKISFMENVHNHPTDPLEYELRCPNLTETEIELIKTLKQYNVNPNEIADILRRKNKKKVTAKTIQNVALGEKAEDEKFGSEPLNNFVIGEAAKGGHCRSGIMNVIVKIFHHYSGCF